MMVFGDGEGARAHFHVGGVAPICAASADMPQVHRCVFYVGADTPYTVNYYAAAMARGAVAENPAGAEGRAS